MKQRAKEREREVLKNDNDVVMDGCYTQTGT